MHILFVRSCYFLVQSMYVLDFLDLHFGISLLSHTYIGTIHLRRRQILAIFDPYPPPIGNHRHSSKMPPPPLKKDVGI